MHESAASNSSRLKGDLDNIVLKALRKEPERRYATVAQLSEDIRRHLRGLPVAATPDSLAYRVRKFVRRHTAGVAAAALITVAVLGGVVTTLWEARIAAAHERRAEKRFNDVRQLSNTLMFEVHDAIQDLPGATPARKLIVQRSLEYLSVLDKDSSGDISVERELASAYERIGRVQGNPEGANLGDITGALDSFGRALSIREKIARRSDDNPDDLMALAASYREMCGMNARFLGSIGTALDYCNKALSMTEKLNQAEPENRARQMELAKAYEAAGKVYGEDSSIGNSGNFFAALDVHRKALALVDALSQASPADPALRSWQGTLSLLTADDLFFTGRMSQALPLYRQATRDFEDLTRQYNNPSYVRSLIVSYQRLGDMQLTDGHYAQMLAYYRKELDIADGMVSADPKNMVSRIDIAAIHATYGHALWLAGRVPEGIAYLRRSLAEVLESRQQDSRAKGLEAIARVWMAGAFEKKGDLSGALRFYLQARASYDAICISDPKDAEDCLELASVQDRIARIYLRRGKLDEALAEYQKAVALSELRSGGAEPNLEALYSAMNSYYGMGEVWVARARRSGTREKKLQAWKEARSWYQKSQADFLRIPGWHPITPNEFDAVSPKQIEARLWLCQSALGPGTASRQNSADASSPFGKSR